MLEPSHLPSPHTPPFPDASFLQTKAGVYPQVCLCPPASQLKSGYLLKDILDPLSRGEEDVT